MKETVKSCSTCEHRIGSGVYARCSFSGTYCNIVKTHNLGCCNNFEGWAKKRGVIQRILEWF